MDYSQLSDQQINMLVAEIEHPDRKIIESKSRPPSVLMLGEIYSWFDYCNNPADAWPIIVEQKICIYAMSEADKRGAWGAEAFHPDESYHFSDNPLRAAMIVFLMMQDAKHG